MTKSYQKLLADNVALNALRDKVLNRVHQVTSSLNAQKIYKLKDLYGKKRWEKLSAAERYIAEGCLCDFVHTKNVMLKYVGTSCNNHALFKPA